MPPDPLSDCVEDGRKEKERVAVNFRKEVGNAGFHLKMKGGKKAVDAFVKILNDIDLSEHQLPEDE